MCYYQQPCHRCNVWVLPQRKPPGSHSWHHFPNEQGLSSVLCQWCGFWTRVPSLQEDCSRLSQVNVLCHWQALEGQNFRSLYSLLHKHILAWALFFPSEYILNVGDIWIYSVWYSCHLVHAHLCVCHFHICWTLDYGPQEFYIHTQSFCVQYNKQVRYASWDIHHIVVLVILHEK